MLKEIASCRKCPLCFNQLPLLDKKEKCDVMWVGLSSKKVENLDKNYPLEENTNSGKIIKEVEQMLPNVSYYKTNLVKCLPLDDKQKLRYPTTEEMNVCISNLVKEVEYLHPKIVFLLGEKVATFVEKYYKKYPVNYPVVFKKVEHPSYIYVYRKKNKADYIYKLVQMIQETVVDKTV